MVSGVRLLLLTELSGFTGVGRGTLLVSQLSSLSLYGDGTLSLSSSSGGMCVLVLLCPAVSSAAVVSICVCSV